MPEVLVANVNSYFAIYALENASDFDEAPVGRAARGMNWDLHATATDRTMAISHARMLAMQPGISEVHVKQVTENLKSGLVRVRDIKCCRRGNMMQAVRAYAWPISGGFLMLTALMALFAG